MLEKILEAQRAAWARSERKLVEAILAEQCAGQPIESFDKDVLLSLICSEDAIRRQQGEQPTLQEYQSRFPQLSDELAVQWEINAMLAAVPGEQAAKIKPKALNVVPIVVGRYTIRREIGRGAMGIVYEAYDLMLKRVVALKRLRSGIDADASELQRITSEAEAVAQLNHPNIVQLFDVEMDKEIPHLVMEYCTGGTLESYMNGKPLDAKHAVNLMLQIAAGVAAAHAVGIVHRDLKPANVMLDNPLTLKPKVSDFGLAKRLGLDSNATATGTLIGSPAYMPPEQANGIGNEVGPAADVYSLGAVLYECLTGRPPFRGSSLVDTLDQVRTLEPVQVRQLEPRVPRDLETIVHKCLRKRADQRYANATEFADDLRRFVNHQPILARRESWIETGSRVYRRYPLASSLAAVTAVLLILLTTGSVWFASRENSLRRQSQILQAEALIGRAHGFRLSRRSGQRFEALASLQKATDIGRKLNLPEEWFETVRDEMIAALMLPDVYVENWHDEPAEPFSADYNNDHSHYAVSFEDLDDVQVRDFNSHVELGHIPKPDKRTRVRWVGKSSVFLQGEENGHCELWDLANFPYKISWEFDSCNNFSFSNDQKFLVIADPHWTQVIEVQSGKVRSKFRSPPYARDPQMALHPIEPWLARFSYSHEDLEIRNWVTNEQVQLLVPDEGTTTKRNYSGADWSPDGKTLFMTQGDGQSQHIYRFDGVTRKYILSYSDHPTKINGWGGAVVRFNSHGDRILSRSWLTAIELFDVDVNHSLFMSDSVIPLNNGHVSELPRVDPHEQYANFGLNPNASKSLGLTSIAMGREAKFLIPRIDNQVSYGRVVDPTGRFLLGTSKDCFVIADAQTGRPLLKKDIKDFEVHCFAFDQKGNFCFVGQCGHYSCSYKVRDSAPYEIELGIPRRIHMPFGNLIIGCSDDGQTVAGSAPKGYGTQEYIGQWIKLPEEPAALRFIGETTVSTCSVSPNGKFIAGTTSVEGNAHTLLWNCSETPTLEKDFIGDSHPRFSRDGSKLLASGMMIQLDNLQTTAAFNEGIPHDLSDDGSLVVFGKNGGTLGLADAKTGKTLGRFSAQHSMLSPVFSPDGERVTCYSSSGGLMQINFRLIRESLVEKGLDWKSPEFTENTQRLASAHPIERALFPPELESVETADELSDVVDLEAIRRSEQNTTDSDAAFSAAMVYIERADYTQALKLLNRTCELLPNSITARQWRAYLFAAMRDYEQAIADADWVMDKLDNFDFRLLRAEWYFQAKHYQEAVTDCSHVINQGGNRAKYAYGLRAACFEALGDDRAAKEDQTKFHDQTKFDSKSLNYAAEPMSGMDISLRHPALSLRVLRKLQSLDENLPNNVRHSVARVLYINDLYDEVVEHLEACLAKGSEQYESSNLYVLAMAKYQLGQHESAREIFARAEACPIPAAFDFRARRNLRMLQAECKSIVPNQDRINDRPTN